MNEFGLIKHFFQSLSQPDASVIVDSGDDAAIVTVAKGYQLAISTDALVSGVHFLPQWDGYDVAIKSLAVNLSDMAAMGAIPKWVNIALCLPDKDMVWLERFSLGLADMLSQYKVSLIGGDLTQGPLTIAVTIQGWVANDKYLTRSQASVGDSIFVTGTLGAAKLAVENLQQCRLSDADFEHIMNKLQHPVPRIEHGQVLIDYASAAIDISDGLKADLNHICKGSGVGATLYREAIPVDQVLKRNKPNSCIEDALSGGDDYELCFCVSQSNKHSMEQALKAQNLPYYEIGCIEQQPGLRLQDNSGYCIPIKPDGYQHFDG